MYDTAIHLRWWRSGDLIFWVDYNGDYPAGTREEMAKEKECCREENGGGEERWLGGRRRRRWWWKRRRKWLRGRKRENMKRKNKKKKRGDWPSAPLVARSQHARDRFVSPRCDAKRSFSWRQLGRSRFTAFLSSGFLRELTIFLVSPSARCRMTPISISGDNSKQ